jgi:hypothetical protein
MTKDQIYAEFNVPKELSADLDEKFNAEFDAFIGSFRREPTPSKSNPSQCLSNKLSNPRVLLEYDLNQIRRICNKTAELYEQGMSYHEAFAKAKKIEGWG